MKADAPKTIEPIVATTAPAERPEAVRLDDLAREAGLLPEGQASGVAARPFAQNPKFWIYRAICDRYRWNEHSRITRTAFETAVKAVSHFSV